MKIAVATNLLQLSVQPPTPSSQYVALPPPRCDFVGIVRPLSDVIVSNLLGFAPYFAIIAAVVLALVLVIVAASRRGRNTVLPNLGAVVIAAVVLTIVLGGIGLLITSPCGT